MDSSQDYNYSSILNKTSLDIDTESLIIKSLVPFDSAIACLHEHNNIDGHANLRTCLIGSGLSYVFDENTETGTLDNNSSHIRTQLSATAPITYDNTTGIISANKDVANGLPTLDSNGLLRTSQFPLIAINEIWTVADEKSQLALTAEEGDIAVRTDENKSYCHNGGTAGNMNDWTWLRTPTDLVLSVNGETGVVSLNTSHISESSNLYYTTARQNTDFDTRLATKTTSDVTESGNLYYTTTRQNTDFDTRLATKTTSNLTESGNLYYTDSRARNALSAGVGISYNSSTGVITSTSAIDHINGTSNQIIVTEASPNITLSLPQSIATSSIVQFGNIGINRSSQAELDIQTTGSSTSIYLRGMTGTVESILACDGTKTFIGSNTNTPLQLATNGSTRMTIDTSGRVGVNTTSVAPVDYLTVNSAGNTYGLGVRYDNSLPNLRGMLYHQGNAGGLCIAAQGANNSTNGSGDIRFLTSTSNSVNGSTDATLYEKMKISYLGKVTIQQSGAGSTYGLALVQSGVGGSSLFFDTTTKLRDDGGNGISFVKHDNNVYASIDSSSRFGVNNQFYMLVDTAVNPSNTAYYNVTWTNSSSSSNCPITKTTSTTTGDYFTVNKAGLYAIQCSYVSSDGAGGISKNYAGTNPFDLTTGANFIVYNSFVNSSGSLSCTYYFAVNDVIRLHFNKGSVTGQIAITQSNIWHASIIFIH